ncbi:response regulator [Thermodesulfobacteriota bacterium]
MGSEETILVVDDDPHIREVVCFALRSAGFRTVEAKDGREALALVEEQSPDLIVLDILMPELDGIEVCRSLRSSSTVPIVFLSSKDEEVDRIVGLELGGDDYVTKPFSPRELVARIKAVLRRAAGSKKSATEERKPKFIGHGRLKLDLDRFQAFWGSAEVVLTVTEFGLVRTLLGYPGKVYTRDELMSGAYSMDNIVTDRTIDSHIRRVRRKFSDAGGEIVETVHGMGYRLSDCE